jgi:hypothetical protein
LHPDFARWSAEDEAAALMQALARYEDEGARDAYLNVILGSHTMSGEPDQLSTTGDELPTPQWLDHRVEELLQRYVRPPRSDLPRRKRAKPASRLQRELRDWLKASGVFSKRVEDLGKGRVVEGFPISVAQELYTDFALKNGALHVIETLDLRGIPRLTPLIRGEAAVKAITLDEARDAVDGERMAVIRASDYAIAKPAVSLIERYASDVFIMDSPSDRQRLAEFFHTTLKKDLQQIPA